MDNHVLRVGDAVAVGITIGVSLGAENAAKETKDFSIVYGQEAAQLCVPLTGSVHQVVTFAANLFKKKVTGHYFSTAQPLANLATAMSSARL